MSESRAPEHEALACVSRAMGALVLRRQCVHAYLQATFVAHGVDVQQASETQRTGMLGRVLRMGHWREFG